MRDRFVVLIVVCALVLAAPAAQPAGAQQAPPAPGVQVPSAPTSGPLPPIPPVPTLAPHPLTLADALTAALQNNFQTRQAALAVAVARAQLREAEAQKAVTLGGSASFTDNSLSGSAPVSGTISIPGSGITNQPFTATGFGGTAATNSVFALTFKYPLYTGGALEAQIAIARANELIAEAQFAAAAEQVVFSVRQAYYAVTASGANVVSAHHAVDAAL